MIKTVCLLTPEKFVYISVLLRRGEVRENEIWTKNIGTKRRTLASLASLALKRHTWEKQNSTSFYSVYERIETSRKGSEGSVRNSRCRLLKGIRKPPRLILIILSTPLIHPRVSPRSLSRPDELWPITNPIGSLSSSHCLHRPIMCTSV